MAILKIGKMIMKSMFSKPATLMFPVVNREWQERTRGHIEIDIDSCIFCGICARKCPTDALSVSKGEGSWTIQRMQCIQCSCCVEVCPKKCLVNEPDYTQPDVVKIVDVYKKEAVPGGAETGGAAGSASAGEGGAGSTSASYPDDGILKCNDTCIFCGICQKKCPQSALSVSRAKKNKDTGELEGENSWKVDMEACIRCGICLDACPKKSLVIE
ncbi:hypothetical protein FACS1894127_1390 [Clostridia bacterium]|nr:hypothetical protein FACS1894127_1390 [Clostridia bacterium]